MDIIWYWNYHRVQSHPNPYLQGSNVSVRDVFLSGVSKINIHPEDCSGDLKWLPQLLYLYQWYSRVHTIDLPGHIRLDGGFKPSHSPQQFQGLFSGAFGVGQSRARFGWSKVIHPKTVSSDNMDCHWFWNPPERHGWSGISERFLYVAIELFNIRDMFLIGHKIEGDSNISHFWA